MEDTFSALSVTGLYNEDYQRGCYIRTMSARVKLQKKSLVAVLKGFDTQTN
jgi:hypothetical protein